MKSFLFSFDPNIKRSPPFLKIYGYSRHKLSPFPFHVFSVQNSPSPFLLSNFRSHVFFPSRPLSFKGDLFATDARIWIHTAHSSIIMHCYCPKRHEEACAFNASGDLYITRTAMSVTTGMNNEPFPFGSPSLSARRKTF